MTGQARLPGVDPPRQIRPDASRRDPTVWIRRLRVLRALGSGNEHVVRDIELRRGLNLICAPPARTDTDNALFRSGVGGHTAGKTTLCRFVRYALGEGSFAPENARRRIRAKFPEGWVVAEVVVAGRLWLVARPFAVGPHPFCVEGGNIEEPAPAGDRSDYETFLAAVAEATTSVLPAGRFPARDEPLQWQHVLPWLTRDQECRFSNFLEWRHGATHSDLPSLSVDERQFVVRSVLGLITDEERQEQQRNAHLVAAKKEAERTAPLLAHEADVTHERVKGLLGIEVPPPSSGLFGSQTRTEIDRRRSELTERMRRLSDEDQRDALRTRLEGSVAAETNARRDLEDLNNRLALEHEVVKQLQGRARGEKQTDLLASLPPGRDYCNVPMGLARERGCPIAINRPHDLEEQRSRRSATEELQIQQAVVQALEAETEKKRAALEAAESGTRETRKAYVKSATAHEEARSRLLEERAQLDQISRLADEAEEAWRRAEERTETIKRLASDIEGSYSRQEHLRQAATRALAHFSSTFDYVVRALLGDQVVAKVETLGRELKLVVEDHGERDSAALATLKLWAFDLAAMTSSVEGTGFFPRFLLHDGPRDGDIAPDIYERLFLYVRQLEACFSGEPNFQYIITTTTHPPQELMTEPWLRLKLSGTPAEARLLRTDL